jgi:thiol-disulfide isomerase/thioredoxin
MQTKLSPGMIHRLYKKNQLYLLLLLFVLFLSCRKETGTDLVSQQIIVTGKIDNYDPEKPIVLGVNRLGFSSEQITAGTDSLGNFTATFDSYIPTDVAIFYKTNFWVLLHPGDSLFVHFDGEKDNRPELLESIRFGGDVAKTNQDAAKFQLMYFSNPLYFDWDKKNRAVKEYDTDQYSLYLDTIRQQGKEIFDRFVSENSPNEETKIWALAFAEDSYYTQLSFYAKDHRTANNLGGLIREGDDFNLKNDWDVPKGFYNSLTDRLPIDSSLFISAYALNSFADRFKSYVTDNMRETEPDSTSVFVVLPGGSWVSSSEKSDSIAIYNTIKFVQDPLLLQIMLTNLFSRRFDSQNITAFEQYRELVDTYIKEPFLKEPLYQKYLQTKSRIDNPDIYSEAVLLNVANSSVNQVMDSILQPNKNKVIYVDFWATWCGPCLSEFPNSKVIEQEMKGKDVVFVYVCLESEEQKWKATLDKFQLGGQHFFLSSQQSSQIRQLFEIGGIPFYLLIDKTGVIQEKGSHLRPLNVKSKIEELL